MFAARRHPTLWLGRTTLEGRFEPCPYGRVTMQHPMRMSFLKYNDIESEVNMFTVSYTSFWQKLASFLDQVNDEAL
jgi:hypothetical protein